MTVNYVPPRVAATRLGVSGRKCQLGDLEIYLIAPNNQRTLLQIRTLGRRNQLQNTYTVRSHPALKQLLSLPAKGNWQLQIIDYAALDVGKLNNWELVIGVGNK